MKGWVCLGLWGQGGGGGKCLGKGEDGCSEMHLLLLCSTVFHEQPSAHAGVLSRTNQMRKLTKRSDEMKRKR